MKTMKIHNYKCYPFNQVIYHFLIKMNSNLSHTLIYSWINSYFQSKDKYREFWSKTVSSHSLDQKTKAWMGLKKMKSEAQ